MTFPYFAMDSLNSTVAYPTSFSAVITAMSQKGASVAPYAISPYDVVSHLWHAVAGYPAEEFDFKEGRTPMSTLRETVTALVVYYIVIFGGRELMRNRQPFKLNSLFIVHNAYLTAISGLLLCAFIQQLAPGLWKNGLYDGICGQTGWTQPLVVLYYLNYLTKYLELLDTVFLVLKKKPLTFLHTYHHGATAALCYSQLMGHTSVSWVPITLNLIVHVVMYYYYAQAARGVRVWWKKYITMLQISQFVIDLGFVYYASWEYISDEYAPFLPHYGEHGSCRAGTEFAAISGCTILSSYLVLFIMFYFSTYKKSSQKALKTMETSEIPTVPESAQKAQEAFKAANEAMHDMADKVPN